MRPAKNCLALLVGAFCASAVYADTFGTGTNQFTIDFVTIGNPGNAADTTGNPNPAGSVGYVYQIGKYEVSRDMITKANAAGGLGITLNDMGFVTGGARSQMPATGVSWNEAGRFVNWLNTSQGFHPAYKFDLEPGDAGYSPDANIILWQASDSGYDAANPFRNTLAQYFLPSVDEWYKAAYYDPKANGGQGGYWDFPTGSDAPPAAISGGKAAGTAVYLQGWTPGPADIDNAGGLSPYGVMGLGGNVWELDETSDNLVNSDSSSVRGIHGGDWEQDLMMGAYVRSAVNPRKGYYNLGFRVASLPVFACGDFDKDLDVDSADLVGFLAVWTGEGGTGATRDRGDCDVDGDVDSADMLTFLSNWTGSAESDRLASVPEPASGALVGSAVAGLLLAQRRRRV